MTGIEPLDAETCEGLPKLILQGVQEMGIVPDNLYRALAHSPAAIEGYHFLQQSLERAMLEKPLRCAIALAVAGAHQNDYGAARAAAAARALGIDEEELQGNLMGLSGNSRTAAVLRFARVLMAKQGRVGDDDRAALRASGLSDREIVEVIAVVSFNIFTSYFSQAASLGRDGASRRPTRPAAA